MTKAEQAALVSELMCNAKEIVLKRIWADLIPGDWDGLELREYLVELFRRERGVISRHRLTAYKNAIAVLNL